LKVDWTIFFEPDTPIIALPSWKSPRILLPTQNAVQRWKQSSLFPASRSRARIYRLFLRLKAATGLMQARTVHAASWPIRDFSEDVLPEIVNAVVMMRQSDPAQRSTAQLWDEKDRVVGYLRYAEKEIARRRLQQEYTLLLQLPDDIGPKPLKYGPMGKGLALLKTPLSGRPVTANPPRPGELADLLDALIVTEPVALEIHPWVRHMRSRASFDIDAWLEPLGTRDWPVAIQHGDLTPWNLLRTSEGKLQAVDWEHGTLEGFPCIDLAHYSLQISALIHRQSPSDAVREAIDCLLSHGSTSFCLSEEQARALVSLAAYEAYLKTMEDGQKPDSRLQSWRRTIWSNYSQHYSALQGS
jgi:hypothetical protein